LTEAARAGVPVIGIPLFGDQQYNSRVAKFAGIGIEVDVRQLNGPNAEEIMIEAVGKVKKNIVKI
jgi:UDP:flavonoid glycosyltransferase YjiC (YdhE family)